MRERTLLAKSFAAAIVLLWAAGARAQVADTPPPSQGPGEHSSITTSDGSIRDDELAAFIKQKINELPDTANKPSDVKLFFQTCFGGGMLDDLGGAFDMLGIPWVGGAASAPDESSWGPGDPTTKGDFWTDELVKAINAGGAGDTVKGDISSANANNPARPGGKINKAYPHVFENPVMASGGGGANIKWNDSMRHEVVLFAGVPDGQRHINDLNNMSNALGNVLTGENIQSSQTAGRTEQDLKDMIMTAINNIADSDESTQLVLYFSDHGDTHFDVDEYINSLFELPPEEPILIDPGFGLLEPLPLHPGWAQGISEAQLLPTPVEPTLTLELDPLSPPMPLDEWQVILGDFPLPLQPGQILQPGQELILPIDPFILADPFLEQFLAIVPFGEASNELLFSNIELSSGGITTLVAPPLLDGDFNLDGRVDIEDLDILANNFGLPAGATLEQGDANGDGRVDIVDLDVLANNFGASVDNGTAVPEPTAIAIALAMVAGLAPRQRRVAA